MKLCKIKGCKKEIVAKQICNTHYMQVKRRGCILNYDYHHGLQNTRFYNSWRAMKERCTNPKNANTKYYMGKGIKLYPLWEVFENFKNDMHKKFLTKAKKYGEKNITIERIDGNKGYYPDNCRWATYKEQWRNKSNSRKITFKGKTKILSEWAKNIGISPSTLSERIQKWDIEKALSTPKLH